MKTDEERKSLAIILEENASTIKTLKTEADNITRLIEWGMSPLGLFYQDTLEKKRNKIQYLEQLNKYLNIVIASLNDEDQPLKEQLIPIQSAYHHTYSIAYANKKMIYAAGTVNIIREKDRGRTGTRISATLNTISSIKRKFEEEIAKNQITEIELRPMSENS